MRANFSEFFFLSEAMRSKIKNRTLFSGSGKSWIHFKTNPKSVSLDLEEKSGTHKQKKITLRKTPNKFHFKNHFFFFNMRYRKKLRIVRYRLSTVANRMDRCKNVSGILLQ